MIKSSTCEACRQARICLPETCYWTGFLAKQRNIGVKIPILPHWASDLAPTSNMALTLVVPFGTKDMVSKAPNTSLVVTRPVLDIQKFFKVQQALFSRMQYLNSVHVCVHVYREGKVSRSSKVSKQ